MDSKLEQLSSLLSRKQSKEYYAKKLDITIAEVEDLLGQLREPKMSSNIMDTLVNIKRINIEKGEREVNSYWDHEPTPDELIKAQGLDTNFWNLKQYWSKGKEKGFQVSAMFAQKKTEAVNIKQEFQEFLKTYKHRQTITSVKLSNKKLGVIDNCLVINKQDSHLNAFDVNGNNDINKRFEVIYSKVERIVKQAAIQGNLTNIVYIVGSDEFNSEWTGRTTHDTPQENILPFHQGFQAVCDHEVEMLNLLSSYTDNLKVLYIPGNHDEYLGWHLASWLGAYFRDIDNISFDISNKYSKYVHFSNTAMCFNHGYKIKAEILAQNFPIEFKEHWSSCDNYLCFTGDKHCEISKTIGAIHFHRLSATTNAVSRWSEEQGYTVGKGAITAFLIEAGEGLTNTYRQKV